MRQYNTETDRLVERDNRLTAKNVERILGKAKREGKPLGAGFDCCITEEDVAWIAQQEVWMEDEMRGVVLKPRLHSLHKTMSHLKSRYRAIKKTQGLVSRKLKTALTGPF